MSNITDSHGSHVYISDDVNPEDIDVESMLGVESSIDLPTLKLCNVEGKVVKTNLSRPEAMDVTIELTIQHANVLFEECITSLVARPCSLHVNGNQYSYMFEPPINIEYNEQFQNALCHIHLLSK